MSMAAATRDGQVRGPDGAFADSPQMQGFNDDVVSAQPSCHLGSLNAWAAVTQHRVWHLGIEFGVSFIACLAPTESRQQGLVRQLPTQFRQLTSIFRVTDVVA
jgi:hypothetical protein